MSVIIHKEDEVPVIVHGCDRCWFLNIYVNKVKRKVCGSCGVWQQKTTQFIDM